MPDSQQQKPDISSMLQGLLSNPQLLGNIASMIGTMSSQGQAQHASATENEEYAGASDSMSASVMSAQNIQSTQTLPPSLPTFHEKPGTQSKEKALLCALKPFLSSRKCQTLDTIIRLLDIVSLVGGIK